MKEVIGGLPGVDKIDFNLLNGTMTASFKECILDANEIDGVGGFRDYSNTRNPCHDQ